MRYRVSDLNPIKRVAFVVFKFFVKTEAVWRFWGARKAKRTILLRGRAVPRQICYYNLPTIRLAFLPSYIFSVDEYVTLIENGIRARYVSPMHYPYQHPPTGIEENISNAVVFKAVLENWVVPIE